MSRNERYTGDHGTENFIDDHFFAPLILLGIIMACIIAALALLVPTIGGMPALAIGFAAGLFVNVVLVRKEMQYRRENNGGD